MDNKFMSNPHHEAAKRAQREAESQSGPQTLSEELIAQIVGRASDTVLKNLSPRIDAAEKTVGEVTAQLGAMKEKVEARTTSPAVIVQGAPADPRVEHVTEVLDDSEVNKILKLIADLQQKQRELSEANAALTEQNEALEAKLTEWEQLLKSETSEEDAEEEKSESEEKSETKEVKTETKPAAQQQSKKNKR